MGASPATQPTQNLGAVSAGMQTAAVALKALTMALLQVGSHTPIGQAINDAIGKIGKLIPPGAVSPAGEQNAMQKMMMQHQQNGAHVAAQAAQHPPGGPPGAGGPPPGAGAAPPPPPG